MAAPPSPKLPPWPHYDQDEIDAVAEVLRSGKVNYWTGDTVRAFESAYAKSLGRKHAIALANGAKGEDRFGYRAEAVELMRLADAIDQN